jgi:hypothetical protein
MSFLFLSLPTSTTTSKYVINCPRFLALFIPRFFRDLLLSNHAESRSQLRLCRFDRSDPGESMARLRRISISISVFFLLFLSCAHWRSSTLNQARLVACINCTHCRLLEHAFSIEQLRTANVVSSPLWNRVRCGARVADGLCRCIVLDCSQYECTCLRSLPYM